MNKITHHIENPNTGGVFSPGNTEGDPRPPEEDHFYTGKTETLKVGNPSDSQKGTETTDTPTGGGNQEVPETQKRE